MTTQTPPAHAPTETLPLSALTGAEALYMRHRANGRGQWRQIGSIEERPNRDYFVVALVGEGWRLVDFSELKVSAWTKRTTANTPKNKTKKKVKGSVNHVLTHDLS